MLAAIGGYRSKVGTSVRACHERFDGRGYPDGPAGEAIPAAARIVFCCDAFDAMTTDGRTAAPGPLPRRWPRCAHAPAPSLTHGSSPRSRSCSETSSTSRASGRRNPR